MYARDPSFTPAYYLPCSNQNRPSTRNPTVDSRRPPDKTSHCENVRVKPQTFWHTIRRHCRTACLVLSNFGMRELQHLFIPNDNVVHFLCLFLSRKIYYQFSRCLIKIYHSGYSACRNFISSVKCSCRICSFSVCFT